MCTELRRIYANNLFGINDEWRENSTYGFRPYIIENKYLG